MFAPEVTMKLIKFVTAGLVSAALALGSTGVAQAAETATDPAPSTCLPENHDDTWPAGAEGRAPLDAPVRVWHDTNGWHVRVTHRTLRDRTFSGAIHTRGELIDVQAVKLEGNDTLKVSDDKHTIRFRFNNYGHVDGFDFKTHCAPSLQFGFLSNGRVVPRRAIAIGARGLHPRTNPFSISRTA
jgi:hypothetical protein